MRVGWVELKHLPCDPRLPPGLLRQKRPSQPSGWINTPPAGTRSEMTGTGGKVTDTPGSGRAVREQRARAPPAEPARSQWELEVRGRGDAGPRLGQSGSGRGPGGRRWEERPGAMETAASTEVSHLSQRGALPHLCTPPAPRGREQGPKLLSPPPFNGSLHARGRLLGAPTPAGLLSMLSTGRQGARDRLALGN